MGVFSLFKQMFTKEDLRTDDKLGVYPEKVHVPAFLERRYLKTSRVLAVVGIISMCLNIMFGSILFVQPSMVSSEPIPYAYNENFRRFRRLENMYETKLAEDLIFEGHVREYIYLRHTVIPDIDVMKIRWNPASKFYWMSGSDVYNSFKSFEYTKTLSLVTNSGFRRDVYFRWTRKIRPGRWEAEFDTYEYHGWQRNQGTRKRWRSFLVIGVNPNIPFGSRENKLKNPLNIVIRGYFQTSIVARN